MTEAATTAYRAYISHARADARWAKWLHRRLESFNIEPNMVGVETAQGVVPPSLRPVFRGQEKSSSQRELGYEAISALYDSAALIVLCSPASARSAYVSETVRLFKSRHPERLVIPVIIGGEPGGGGRECYPRALRFRLDRDEQIIAAPASLLAVDARPGRGSRDLALAKIVARLLGMPRYDLFRQEEGRQGRSGLRAAVVLAIIALAVFGAMQGGASFRWLLDQQPQSRSEVETLVRRLGRTKEAPPDPRRAGELLTGAVAAIVEGAKADARYAEALEFLRKGKTAEAEPLLRKLAEDEAARGEQGARRAAARFHCLGVIAGLADPQAAQEAYVRAAALDPGNPEWQRDVAFGYAALAERYRRSGELGMAALALREGKAILERMIKLSPDNAVWRKDLAWLSGRLAELRGDEAAGKK